MNHRAQWAVALSLAFLALPLASQDGGAQAPTASAGLAQGPAAAKAGKGDSEKAGKDSSRLSLSVETFLGWTDRDLSGGSPLDAKAELGVSAKVAPGADLEASVIAGMEGVKLGKAVASLGLPLGMELDVGYRKTALTASGFLPSEALDAAWEGAGERWLDGTWVRRAPFLSLGSASEKGRTLSWAAEAAFDQGQVTPQTSLDLLWRFRGKASALGAAFSYYPRFVWTDSGMTTKAFEHCWMGSLLAQDGRGPFVWGLQGSFGTNLPEVPAALSGYPPIATPQPSPFVAFDLRAGGDWGTKELRCRSTAALAWLSKGPFPGKTDAETDLEIWASQRLLARKALSLTFDAGWLWKARPSGNASQPLLGISVGLEK